MPAIAISPFFTRCLIRRSENRERRSRPKNSEPDNKKPRMLFGNFRRFYEARRTYRENEMEPQDAPLLPKRDTVLLDIDGRRSSCELDGIAENLESVPSALDKGYDTRGCRSNPKSEGELENVGSLPKLPPKESKKEKNEFAIENKDERVELVIEEIATAVPEEEHELGVENKNQMHDLIKKKNVQIRDLNQKIIDLESNREYSKKLAKFRAELNSANSRKEYLEEKNKKLMKQMAVVREFVKLNACSGSWDELLIPDPAQPSSDTSMVTETQYHDLEVENQALKKKLEKVTNEHELQVKVFRQEIQEWKNLEEDVQQMEQMIDNEREMSRLLKEKDDLMEGQKMEIIKLESNMHRFPKSRELDSEMHLSNSSNECDEHRTSSDDACDKQQTSNSGRKSRDTSTLSEIYFEDLEVESRELENEKKSIAKEYEHKLKQHDDEPPRHAYSEDDHALFKEMLDNETRMRELIKEKNNRIRKLEMKITQSDSNEKYTSGLLASLSRIGELEFENENLVKKLAQVIECTELRACSHDSCEKRRLQYSSDNPADALTNPNRFYKYQEVENQLRQREKQEMAKVKEREIILLKEEVRELGDFGEHVTQLKQMLGDRTHMQEIMKEKDNQIHALEEKICELESNDKHNRNLSDIVTKFDRLPSELDDPNLHIIELGSENGEIESQLSTVKKCNSKTQKFFDSSLHDDKDSVLNRRMGSEYKVENKAELKICEEAVAKKNRSELQNSKFYRAPEYIEILGEE